jgi:hypothetical protein
LSVHSISVSTRSVRLNCRDSCQVAAALEQRQWVVRAGRLAVARPQREDEVEPAGVVVLAAVLAGALAARTAVPWS